MPIRQPLTTSFDVVSLRDDALHDVPKVLMDQYEATRDLDILRQANEELGWPGLDKLPVQPTIARCRPMRSRFQRLVSMSMDADDQWVIFAGECERLDNMMNGAGNRADTSEWWEGKGDDRAIKDSVRDKIPHIYFGEMANVIIQKGTTGKDSPFVSLGTWDASRRIRAHQRRVATIKSLATSETTASETPSESLAVTPPGTKSNPPPTGES